MARFGIGARGSDGSDPDGERERLVERLRQQSSVSDPRILDAFRSVPRHQFLPEPRRALAYADQALPLMEQQTMSQPSMIAIMLEALRCQSTDHVLEVGAGCGYAAALLGRLAAEVHAMEIRPNLAELARSTLAALQVSNVHIHVGDGRHGLPEHAPYQRILVSAAAPAVPPALLQQLDVGGTIAIPVDDQLGQTLMIGQRHTPTDVHWTRSVPCLWVPLIAGS